MQKYYIIDGEEKFPGYVREFGVTASYTRFLWKGLYAQLDVMPTYQIFANNNGKKIDEGFQIFLSAINMRDPSCLSHKIT